MFLFIVGPTKVVSDIPALLMKMPAFAELYIQIEKATNPTNIESTASLDELTVEEENLLEQSKLETLQECSGHMMGPPPALCFMH